jgi:hypothetical protein
MPYFPYLEANLNYIEKSHGNIAFVLTRFDSILVTVTVKYVFIDLQLFDLVCGE